MSKPTGNSHGRLSPRGIVTRSLVSKPVAGRINRTTQSGTKLRSHGVPINMGHPVIDKRTVAAVYWGLYERTDINLIRAYLDPHCDVVNLGAGYGVTSVHALALMGDDQRLLAVEANPRLRAPLRSVLRDPRATVVSGAVDYEAEGEAIPFYATENFLRASVRPDGETVAVDVPRVTLSELLDEHRMNTLYTLIMDIEGAEAGILFDDPDALKSCRGVIAELHSRTFRGPTTYRGRTVTAEEMVDRLLELGFTFAQRDRQTYAFVR